MIHISVMAASAMYSPGVGVAEALLVGEEDTLPAGCGIGIGDAVSLSVSSGGGCSVALTCV